MNENAGKPHDQEPVRPTLREVPPEQLKKILEAHRKWVKSEGKEGERADLGGANLEGAKLTGANLQKARLFGANLQGAVLGGAKALNSTQVKTAVNWELAFYSKDFLKELGLSPDHNERVKKKLAEMEKEKKETGAKP